MQGARVKPHEGVKAVAEEYLSRASLGRVFQEAYDRYLQEPLACGHPRACLVLKDTETNLARLNAAAPEKTDEYCSACEREKPLIEALEVCLLFLTNLRVVHEWKDADYAISKVKEALTARGNQAEGGSDD